MLVSPSKTCKSLFFILIALLYCSIPDDLYAQKDSVPLFTTLRMEVRADFSFRHPMTQLANGSVEHGEDAYGFAGKYFNIHVGGNIGKKVSYYFRQRVVANPGSVRFFDNTDFLYINYAINPNWSLRFGKEALAVGGFEYDAAPIDVLFCSYYWDNFYCFQLAASGAYHTRDGNHSIVAQVGASPYLHYGSFYQNSLMSYNLMWSGKFGPFQTLYSINMFERERGKFMNYIALGNKLRFKKWDLYVDLIHHATHLGQLMRNFAVISCANVYFNDYVNLFVKAGYEQNFDRDEILHYRNTEELWDCLAIPGQQYFFGGLGVEIRPRACPDIRIHAFAADFCTRDYAQPIAANLSDIDVPTRHGLTANVGLTWNINFLKYLQKQ